MIAHRETVALKVDDDKSYSMPGLEKAISSVYWIAAILLILSLVAPLIETYRLMRINWPYEILGLFCHQKASRCWVVLSAPLGLCVRCVSLLIFVVTSNVFSIYTKSKLTMILLLIPMALDGGTQLLDFRESTSMLRFVTGGLAGIAIHLYLKQFHREYIRAGTKDGKQA